MLKLHPEAAPARKKSGALVTSSGTPLAIVASNIPSMHGLLLSAIPHEEEGGTERVRLPVNTTFQLLPNPTESKRDTLMISGPSGCGKSTLAGGFCRRYCALFPEAPCYLICGASGDKDPAFADLFASGRMKQIPLAELEGLDLESGFPEKCCVVVDDIESSSKKELLEIERVQKGFLCLGRKPCWTTILLGHVACDGSRAARYTLAECDSIVIFPRVTMHGQTAYLCEKKLGLTKDQIKDLRRLPSRWVCIRKNNTPSPLLICESESYVL